MTDYNSYKYCQAPKGANENRWAAEEEIKAGLERIRLSERGPVLRGGVPVISDGEEVWADTSDSHTLVIGSTGSKKTRLFVMPSLEVFRKARESIVVSDPKGELYRMTAQAYAEDGYDVKVLNLRDPGRSDCWNPLALARKYFNSGNTDGAAQVVADFTQCMIPDTPGSSKDPFWDHASRAMMRGLCMTMVEKPEYFADADVNVATLQSLGNGIYEDGTAGPVYDFVKEHYPSDSLALSNLNSVVRAPERTYSCICVSYDAAVSYFYIQHSLVEMLSCNTVDFHTIGVKPTILYMIIPDERTTLNMIVSLCVKQLYQQLIDTAQEYPDNRLPVRVNFLLDEFSNLPAIPDMAAMISAGRSRNIRFQLIIQGLEQLISRYGNEVAQTIKANCQNWFFLTSRELSLLNEISDLCGRGSKGTPLISPVQLQHLRKDRGEALMLIGRYFPYIAHLPDISEYTGMGQERKVRPLPGRRNRMFRYVDAQELIQRIRGQETEPEKEDDDDMMDIFDTTLDRLLRPRPRKK